MAKVRLNRDWSPPDGLHETDVWKPIPGFPGYEVSRLGRVRSFRRPGPSPLADHPHILTPCLYGTKGREYLRVSLGLDGKTVCGRLHILVLEAFVGPRPEGMDGCHNDGNRLNCRLDNLRWDTKVGNAADKRIHGTVPCGSRNVNAKIEDDDVREIRRLHAAGMTQVAIGRQFGIKQTTVSGIIRRRSWSHV